MLSLVDLSPTAAFGNVTGQNTVDSAVSEENLEGERRTRLQGLFHKPFYVRALNSTINRLTVCPLSSER